MPPGRIRVLNTSQDTDYNVVRVSGGGASKALKPGDSVLLPKGTSNISFSRQYKNFTREYRVECPRNIAQGISIKLIDVHLNKIAGGCKTTYASKD